MNRDIVPVEMRASRPMQLHEGVWSTTTRVWETLWAAATGDLGSLDRLVTECPQLATCQYNYTPPIHLAVIGGHVDAVRCLLDRAAYDPSYRTYPFQDSLTTLARERGATDIAAMLGEAAGDPRRGRKLEDVGEIDYGRDERATRFQRLVNNRGSKTEIEALLDARPELARDETFSWGEGILMMPSNHGDTPLIDLLLTRGARVPSVSKWCHAYYFKHYDIAAYLLRQGMDANHMSWHRATILHDMAAFGDVRKAELLIGHGAALDVIDDEYQSTPLGFAARWGREEIVRLLLDRGASADTAGAEWATPLAWSRARGHEAVERLLLEAGATGLPA